MLCGFYDLGFGGWECLACEFIHHVRFRGVDEYLETIFLFRDHSRLRSFSAGSLEPVGHQLDLRS